MKILFCGDIVGRAGRDAVERYVPILRQKLALDAVVVNAENAANGFGITRKIVDGLFTAGVNVLTLGDHSFDQQEALQFIGDYPHLLRPLNLPAMLPGRGFTVFTLPSGKKLMVILLHAQLFMKLQVNSPFEAVDALLKEYHLTRDADAILVDMHGEATSERMAMGHFLDGRVSAVSGSHTHVPTADCQILPLGTAYQTDAGMCGDYDSVIGFDKQVALKNFLQQVRTGRLTPANGEGTLSGVMIETDDTTGLATAIHPIRMGGRLKEMLP